MPGVDCQSDEDGGDQVKGGGQERNGDKLHGAGIDGHAHEDGPSHVEALAGKEDAEGDPQEQIAHKDGKGQRKGCPECFFAHG